MSGLNCPLPVLRSKTVLAAMGKGQVLKVVSTQSDSGREFAAFCCLPEFEMVKSGRKMKQYFFWIRKAI
ncbi:MAG: sulfurtransferase TusA family protein [Sedimenticola sp.]